MVACCKWSLNARPSAHAAEQVIVRHPTCIRYVKVRISHLMSVVFVSCLSVIDATYTQSYPHHVRPNEEVTAHNR
jgi:hypothetical protein